MDIIQLFKTKIPLPQYDEITLFFINLIIVALLVIDPLARQDLVSYIRYTDPRLFIIMFLGFLFTIYHSLFIEKNNLGKTVMGFYIIFFNFLIGIKGIYYLIGIGYVGYNIIFPAIDTLISIVLIGAMRGNFLEPEEVISDRQARRKELIIGIIFIPVIVAMSQYLLKNNWVITFSICLFYISLVHSFFMKLVFGEKEITEMDFVLDNDQNKKRKLIAKIVLAIIFLVGTTSYFYYGSILQKRGKEARVRSSEELVKENEFYSVYFWMPRYVYKEKDTSTLYNDGQDKNEGEEIKLKGIVKDWIPEKFIPKELNSVVVNKNLRLGFYDSKSGYYTDNRYYVLCDSLYGAPVGEIVEVDGVIGTYNIYRDDNLSDIKSKCILPKSKMKIIDKEALKNVVLKSYKDRAEYIKQVAETAFKDKGVPYEYKSALNKIKDNIDDYNNASYYWIEDKKEYEILLSYNLDKGDKLYFGFFISEKDLKTRELEIFINSGI